MGHSDSSTHSFIQHILSADCMPGTVAGICEHEQRDTHPQHQEHILRWQKQTAGQTGENQEEERRAREKARAPTPVSLPGKSRGQREEPGGLQSMGSWRVGHD